MASSAQCTVVERVEKSQNHFLTFSRFMTDLGMGKHMVAIFLMNSIKIIGFWFFKVSYRRETEA